MRPLSLISLKNLAASRLRTAILLLLILAAAACAMTGFLYSSAIQEAISLADARLGADIIVYPSAAMSKINADFVLMQGTPVQVFKPRSSLAKLADCEDIQAVSFQLYLKAAREDGTEFWIVGYEPGSDFVLAPWSETGSSFLPDGAVLSGAHFTGSEVDTVSLFGQDWPVRCRLLETGSPLDDAVFVNLSTLRLLIDCARSQGNDTYASIDPERDYSAALIRLDSHEAAETAAGWINVYIRKVKAIRSRETLNDVGLNLWRQQGLISGIMTVLFLLLLLALFLTSYMLMSERRSEVYTWFTVGAARKTVRSVFLAETVLIALAALLLAIPVSLLLTLQMNGSLHLPAGAFLPAVLKTALLCLPASLLSTLAASRHLFRQMRGQMLLNF